MSLLIKGMEMPTSCRACHMKMNCDYCEGHECVCVPLHERIGYLNDLLTDKRRDDCPLVLVQPHGRLIDADELYKKFMMLANDEWNKSTGASWADGYIEAALDTEDAPTVIPAEEGE